MRWQQSPRHGGTYPHGRAGFSLVELLVVFGIVMMLFGLLMGAVQRVRQSADRVSRANWLRQRRIDPAVGVFQVPRLRVLFIGNSLTYVNELPTMLQRLVEEAGSQVRLQCASVTFPGYSLQDHLDEGSALRAIREGDWDFVVLQEQRDHLWYPNMWQQFVDAAPVFDQEIQAKGAVTLFYYPWYLRGSFPSREKRMLQQTENAARALTAEIAPVGLAMRAAQKADPALPLIRDDDQIHPLPYGSYLAACVFYATLFNRSPVGMPQRITVSENNPRVLVDVASEHDARLLQEIAWQVVRENQPKWSWQLNPESRQAN